jgi:hypothetical protein
MPLPWGVLLTAADRLLLLALHALVSIALRV